LNLILSIAENVTPKKRANRNKCNFETNKTKTGLSELCFMSIARIFEHFPGSVLPS